MRTKGAELAQACAAIIDNLVEVGTREVSG
jgi:hypothetical protein